MTYAIPLAHNTYVTSTHVPLSTLHDTALSRVVHMFTTTSLFRFYFAILWYIQLVHTKSGTDSGVDKAKVAALTGTEPVRL